MGKGVRFLGKPVITRANQSSIGMGDEVMLISSNRFTALGVSQPVILRTLCADASIRIGDHVGISGSVLCSAMSIEIGNGTLLGSGVMIVDTDFHPLEAFPRRHAPLPTPQEEEAVVVGQNVFVGARTLILKGSTIGDNSVVGAGSVVSGHIPPDVVAAGNPCRVIRPLLDLQTYKVEER